MKGSGKVIAIIAVVAVLAGTGLLAQRLSTSPKSKKLTTHDMELIVNDILPPGQQQQLASNPEQKAQFVKRLRELLALAQQAEAEGYNKKPNVQSQIDLQSDMTLRGAYETKHPDSKVSDEEVNAYYQTNPKAFDDFLQANPELAQRAQGPAAERFKQQFAQIKVQADRARKEGLDKEDATRLRLMLGESDALAQAYVSDMQKGLEGQVTDADVEKYYKDHQNDYEEVRARHILISTRPAPAAGAGDETGPAGDKKDADKKDTDKKPKALSKDEARQKAQSILDRIHKGEDFAKLAQENSDDPGSKKQGGDLDYFTRGRMVPVFEQTAFSLKPGQVSDLVESDYGYHIIKVEDRRIAPLDKVKEEISDKLKQDKLQEKIDQITASSKVEIPENFQINPKPAAAPQFQLPAPEGAAPAEK